MNHQNRLVLACALLVIFVVVAVGILFHSFPDEKEISTKTVDVKTTVTATNYTTSSQQGLVHVTGTLSVGLGN